MKTTLVITVSNEEKTIDKLLDSLSIQTRKPDELIIVDGGSTDGTVEKIRKYTSEESPKMKNDDLKLKIFTKKKLSIAQGRNFGIKMAKYPIIVMTDAGCVVHKDWLERITKPFLNQETDIVAGFYQMMGKSIFQRCLACYLGVLPEKLDPDNFLPSTRSIAFKKRVWEKIGGFDEKLEKAGEDTLFNYQAKKMGAQFTTVADALVDWEMPKIWPEAVKKFYHYAKGDGQIGIWWHPDQRLSTHNLKTMLIFSRYLIGLFLFISFPLVGIFLFFLYLFWAFAKNYRFVRHWQATFITKYQALLILPALQIVSDLAVMAGFISGIMKI